MSASTACESSIFSHFPPTTSQRSMHRQNLKNAARPMFDLGGRLWASKKHIGSCLEQALLQGTRCGCFPDLTPCYAVALMSAPKHTSQTQTQTNTRRRDGHGHSCIMITCTASYVLFASGSLDMHECKHRLHDVSVQCFRKFRLQLKSDKHAPAMIGKRCQANV